MLERRRIDGREHVRLVLRRIRGPRDEPPAVPLDDPRIVAGPENVRSRPCREVDQLVEAEQPVAAHARVRRQPRGVALDER